MRHCNRCDLAFGTDSWTCPGCGSAPECIGGFPCFAPELMQDNTDYDPDYFRLLITLEDGSFWFESRNRLILWALGRSFPGLRSLLEIGVGTGFVTRALRAALPRAEIWGSDVHVEALRFAAERLDDSVRLFQMDARRIPFREEFDL